MESIYLNAFPQIGRIRNPGVMILELQCLRSLPSSRASVGVDVKFSSALISVNQMIIALYTVQ